MIEVAFDGCLKGDFGGIEGDPRQSWGIFRVISRDFLRFFHIGAKERKTQQNR